MRYSLPKGMRYSTLGERYLYYKNEFDFNRVLKWFSKTRIRKNHTIYATVIGRHTKIYKKRFERVIKEPILIDEYSDESEVLDMILEFLPEGVYYDRNIYTDISKCSRCKIDYRNCWRCKNFYGQELAFDLDPENIECPIHGGLEEKMKHHQGLSFCEIEFGIIKNQVVSLYEKLENQYENLKIVYSGRGIHIHVDDGKTIKMTRKQRKNLATELVNNGFAIDEWVTTGSMRLIRLPFSLHGMVSRIVLPLTKKELIKFNPVKDKTCWPKFLI